MSEWTKISSEAVNDKRLKAGEVLSLLRICQIAWEDDRKGETPPLYWKEFVDILGISDSSYFRNIRILEACGYIKIEKVGDRVRYRIPKRGNLGASSSLTDSIKDSKREEDIRRSYLIPNSGNQEIFEELREAGIGEPLRSRLAGDPEIDLEYVRAHRKYSRLKKDPVRYLANRLLNREPVPAAREFAKLDPDGLEARARFVEVFGE